MINDLDESLRQLLIRELPIKNGEVDITFDQPKREWSARLNRPTLNLFLYDVHENKKLRQTQPMWEINQQNGSNVTKRRRPVRVDLQYIVTVWATEPEDEHRLMSRTLMAFFRFPHLPAELLPESLQDQPYPIPLTVAQEEILRNPADLWGAMDNEWRPIIPCVITLAFDPYQAVTEPLVRTRELRIGQSAEPRLRRLNKDSEPDVFWTIGGTLSSDKSLENVQLTLLAATPGVGSTTEAGLRIPLQPEGRFSVGNLKAGEYTLEISVEGGKARKHKITVPSADYNIEV
jgi:hypothetical protein